MGNAQMIEVLKVKLQETKQKMEKLEREIQTLTEQTTSFEEFDSEDYTKLRSFKEDETSKLYKEFFKQI
jgi:hypothetical protein